MLISVVVATLNRPAMLLEAIRSVAAQRYGEWEVVVVDDGSEPPVDANALAPILGNRFALLRHAITQGVPKAKNAGLRVASGEVILHLDDDDLLSEDALTRIAGAYRQYPELDCVFLNIEPFGRFAPGSAENQAASLANFLTRVSTREEQGIIFLDEGLFDALLRSVPMPFQRPAARRGAWNIVGELMPELMFSEPDWAIRASSCCRTAIISTPLSRWRCDGQNFASKPEMMERALENGVHAAELLLARFARSRAQNRRRVLQCRRHVSDAHFSRAYHAFNTTGRVQWRALYRSFLLAPGWPQLSLVIRIIERAVRPHNSRGSVR